MSARTQGNKLTPADIEQLRRAFRDGVPAFEAAHLVNCTRRNANKYYRMFRGYPMPRGRPKTKKTPEPAPPRPSRFYTSTFEL